MHRASKKQERKKIYAIKIWMNLDSVFGIQITKSFLELRTKLKFKVKRSSNQVEVAHSIFLLLFFFWCLFGFIDEKSVIEIPF